jgi:hypothetical protein
VKTTAELHRERGGSRGLSRRNRIRGCQYLGAEFEDPAHRHKIVFAIAFRCACVASTEMLFQIETARLKKKKVIHFTPHATFLQEIAK